MATVNDMLVCPKCRRKLMGKSHPQRFGKEYFAHCCHEYFGVNELVNQWGYDAGDLYPYYPVTHVNYKKSIDANFVFYSEFVGGEPFWANLAEYQDAQAMVGRMIMGVPELDDYADLSATQEYALGIGLQ